MLPAERRARIVLAAKECIGTPWHHQQRQLGVGMDCVGLLTHCAQAINVEVHDQHRYSLRENGTQLLDAIVRHGMMQTFNGSLELGDLLVFKISGVPHHVGIVTALDPILFVHVSSHGQKKCVETELSDHWMLNLHSKWRFADGQFN